jgi:hypothetical protein
MIRSVFFSFLLVVSSVAYGSVPAMDVMVADASGQAAFKGITNTNGTFATGTLRPGHYVVQFNSKTGGLKGNYYAIVVSSGKKMVLANAVPGEKFTGGGVAMRVSVGSGLNITGQIAAETNEAVKRGKKMVWIPPQIGSHMPGHLVEEGSAEAVAARTAGSMSIDALRDKQNNNKD